MHELLIEKIKNIIDKEMPLISNLSNVCALINELPQISWCGFYLKENDILYLGPFQGPVACFKIALDKGVCGYAASNKTSIIVDNVSSFPGHIACSSLTKSEIVVPIIKNNEVLGVIDLDANEYGRFTKADQLFLEQVADIIKDLFI